MELRRTILDKFRRKVIKRIYEKGRETMVSPTRRRRLVSAKKQRAKAPSPAKAELKLPYTPRVIEHPVKREEVFVKPKLAERPVSKKPFIDSYELPARYGITRLTLMVKDPSWIYAYWEIAQESLETIKSKLSQRDIEGATIVLRMYDITLIDFNERNANYYFDIEVGPYIDNWYINLWHDNASYIGELGLRTQDGRFFSLVRSNYVHTPPMSYSPRSEQIWMKITGERPMRPYVVTKIKSLKVDEKIVPSLVEAKKGRKAVYITDEELRRYYSKLSPLLRDIISLRLSKLYGRQIGKKASKYAFILEGESEEEKQKILSGLPDGYFIRKVLLGSSLDIVFLGASERHIKGPGGASEFVQEKIKQHKFFFELNTELIVYGRTEPNAGLWLGDKKIKLRSDGTFSLRFALPDGKMPLEFTAISGDKIEKKKINTSVERKTHYGN